MNSIFLCDAVEYAAPSFFQNINTRNNAHVKSFQEELFNYLSNYPNISGFNIIDPNIQNRKNLVNPNLTKKPTDYEWQKENIKNDSIPGSDSFGIIGISDAFLCPDVVIEIDAWGADQVAKKFLSRTLLYALEGKVTSYPHPIQYFAVLYKQEKSSLSEAINYIQYANIILRSLNKDSSCSAILFYKDQYGTIKIANYDPNLSLRFEVNGSGVITGMDKTAKIAVDLIAPIVKFNRLKSNLGDCVDDVNHGNMTKCNHQTIDKKDVFVTNQWKIFGPDANWNSFVKVVSKWQNLQITNLYNHYQNKKLGNWEPI